MHAHTRTHARTTHARTHTHTRVQVLLRECVNLSDAAVMALTNNCSGLKHLDLMRTDQKYKVRGDCKSLSLSLPLAQLGRLVLLLLLLLLLPLLLLLLVLRGMWQ
jgi:hypothetical protein